MIWFSFLLPVMSCPAVAIATHRPMTSSSHLLFDYKLNYYHDDLIRKRENPYGHGTVSLSLLRTCRQIYQEAKSLFWGKNAFEFSVERASRILREIGQIPSRLITSVVICFGLWGYEALPKALSLLAIRARYGNLKALRLDVASGSYNHMHSGKERNSPNSRGP